MKVAYLQCFCGVSEQMILGALIDAGISMQELKKELVELHIKFEFKIEGSRVEIISEEIDKIRNLDYARLVIEKSSLKKDVIQNITKIFDKIAHLKSEVKINTLSLLYSCAIVIGFKLIGAHKIYISPINVGQGLKESQLGFI
ncbi:nickel insertion protein, partial [Clostridium sp.]|uniref:nickel insertion protein n=1 Tax=Clostridium sp. TaxID=1506 RepID=UPI001A5C8E30